MGILLERDRKGDVGKNYDRFVSIQSLHTEGDLIHTNVTVCFDISIHFLHTERDLARAGFHAPKVYISIHSLHTEGDDLPASLPFLHRHFNPLPPYGGRHITHRNMISCGEFQSTPSAWRETAKLHRKAFFISPILVQSCKKGCKRLHSAPEKMVFFEKREKNLVRNLQHLSVRL